MTNTNWIGPVSQNDKAVLDYLESALASAQEVINSNKTAEAREKEARDKK